MSWNYNYGTSVNQKQVDDFMKKMATQVRLQKQEEAQNEARRAAQRARVADATAMWKADKTMHRQMTIPPTQYTTYNDVTRSLGLKNPLTQDEYNSILNKKYDTYASVNEADLDWSLAQLDDQLNKPLDLSQFRIPRRRITRKPKSQYAKKKSVPGKRKTSKRKTSKRKTSKRKTSKRKTSKRKTSKRKTSKRNYKK